jgi:anti-anti-sigma factor
MTSDIETRIETGPDGIDEVVITGEIDLATAEQFRKILREAAEKYRPLVVNLTDVQYLDSAGVAVLFDQARRSPLEVIVGPGCLVAPVITVARLAEVATVRLRDRDA